MLSFVEALKRIIANVQKTGGAVIERSFPSPLLVQKLREYALHILPEIAGSYHIIFEWFNEGFFEEYIRVCVVHLFKLGIVEDDHIYRLLTKVIEEAIVSAGNGRAGINKKVWEQHNFEEQLIRSLGYIWLELGDEQTYLYTIAQNRWLIAWDYQKSQWKVTGLGQVFMELSPVQAAIFFLSADIVFNTGEFDFHHVSRDMLLNIQSRQDGKEDLLDHIPPILGNLLIRLGIIFLGPYGDESVTPIGQLVLRTVLSTDNFFRDTVLAILQTEEVGGTFQELPSEINELLRLVDQMDLIDEANQESIRTSTQLYQSKKSLDALRVIYPSIEFILNKMLIEAGEAPERFSGLVAKAQYLGQRGIIPPDITHGVEIFTGRNRVVHGNFSPPEDCAALLCPVAFYYLRRLLTEYRPV